MKKILFSALVLSGMVAYAQTGRVGINTDQPRATLDIVGKSITETDKTLPRGVILPHITTSQRNEFETNQLTNGTMIYNISTNTIDVWNGSHWRTLSYDALPVTTYQATVPYTGDEEFERTTCDYGQTSGKVRYSATVEGTGTSTISRADAESKALANAKQKFREQGQSKADAEGTCDKVKLYCSPNGLSYSGDLTVKIDGNNYNKGNIFGLRALTDILQNYPQGGTFDLIGSYDPRDYDNSYNIRDCKFEIIP